MTDREGFWSAIWDFCGVRGPKGERITENSDAIARGEVFPDAELNFGENRVTRTGCEPAIVFRAEKRAHGP